MRIGILNSSRTGGNFYNNRRLIEEAQKLGADARVINHKRTIATVRNFGRQLLEVTETNDLIPVEVDVIIPRIGSDIDSGTRAIDILTSNGVPTTASSEAIRIAKDKFSTLVRLDSHGVPVPYTVAPTGLTPEKPGPMIELVQPHKKQPVIVKTLKGSKGRGVFISESRRSATAQVDGLASNEVDYLVQEYIPPSHESELGGLSTDIRIIVVDGQIIASMERITSNEDEFRSNLDLGGVARSYEPTPREKEIAIRAAEVIGSGIIGYDGMQSERGMLTTEVNVNPYFGIEEVTQTNIAKAIVEYAIKIALK